MKTASSENGRTVTYRRSSGDPISDAAKANIEELLANPNRKIDTSDIPDLPADAWKHAVRGGFYRPVKQAVSLRLDADVLAWLKKDGGVSDAGEPDAAGTDAEGFGGAVGMPGLGGNGYQCLLLPAHLIDLAQSPLLSC